MLAAFFPSGDDDSGREVRESHPAFRGILVLSSLAPGAEGIDPALGKEIGIADPPSGSPDPPGP